MLRDEYRIREITKVKADSLDELAEQLECVDKAPFLEEVKAYNRALRTDIRFNPTVKDGRRTEGLPVPKSNWANPLDQPPFEAYRVTCGITFTVGGLRIDRNAQVLDSDLQPIPGLYAAGELVGGLFYFNYPGGTGLTAGAVFGAPRRHLSSTGGARTTLSVGAVLSLAGLAGATPGPSIVGAIRAPAAERRARVPGRPSGVAAPGAGNQELERALDQMLQSLPG